jgi:hypothetical protein
MVVVGLRHEFSEHSFQHSLIPAPRGLFAFEGRFPSRPPPRPRQHSPQLIASKNSYPRVRTNPKLDRRNRRRRHSATGRRQRNMATCRRCILLSHCPYLNEHHPYKRSCNGGGGSCKRHRRPPRHDSHNDRCCLQCVAHARLTKNRVKTRTDPATGG